MKRLRLTTCLIAAIFAVPLLVTAPLAGNMDGVMMSAGKMMMMKAGHPATPMDHEVTMSDGTTVAVDGTIRLKDGTEFHLQDGEMIMMDGHLMKGGKAVRMSHQEP